MRRTSSLLAASILLVSSWLTACGRDEAPSQAPTPAAPASPPASAAATPAPAASLTLGERITTPLTPLADIAKDPAHYTGKVIATSGKVTAVCQEMGCWMQLEDASGQAHVRMHGHSFFVPRTAPGHLARIQATLVPQGAPAACADNACGNGASAQLQLDATGVEID
jgi:hypothetical protein